MKNKFNAIVFDFDGTLVDSGEGVMKSAQYALESYGIDGSDMSKLRTFIGPPIYVSFKDKYNTDDELTEKLIKKFRERYDVYGVSEVVVYDGVKDTLEILMKSGVKMGIASSKPTLFLKRILKSLELEKYFDTIIGVDMDDNEADKTRLVNRCIQGLGVTDLSEVVMVGDRHFDINGANGAGIKSIGVLYGYGDKEEFENAGADYIVALPKDIIDIVV